MPTTKASKNPFETFISSKGKSYVIKGGMKNNWTRQEFHCQKPKPFWGVGLF